MVATTRGEQPPKKHEMAKSIAAGVIYTVLGGLVLAGILKIIGW